MKTKKVPVAEISVPDTRGTAVYDEELQQLLKESMEKMGMLTPIVVVQTPEGYRLVESAGAWGFALEGARAWLAETLAADPLHAWAARHPDGRELSGRGRTSSVPAAVRRPTDPDRWVVRHYRRGGVVATWLGDRYLGVGVPRPLRELHASLEARRRGIPTPRVVAGTVHPGPVFYRADLVTEEIPGGADLAEVLFGDASPAVDDEVALVAAGALVRALEDACVLHPDLNAKNVVLLARAGGVHAHVVDLDGCRIGPVGARTWGHPMRQRLERSLRKHEARSGRPLGPRAWAALRARYEARGGAA